MAIFTSIGTALGVSATLWGGAAAFGAGVVAAGAAATAVVSMSGGFSGGSGQKQLANQMPGSPTAPKLDDAAARANKIQEEKRRNMARSTSVQTNPLGLKEEATVVRKKLLGG